MTSLGALGLAGVVAGSGCEKLVVTRYRGDIPGSGQGAMDGTGGGALTLDCVLCHIAPTDNGDGVPPQGRRATVLEFPVSTIRAHLHGPSVQSTDCQICHWVNEHGNGRVVLIDPDGNGTYSFVTPADLTTDPDVSDFCMACHDADGATRLTEPRSPFGNVPAPDIKQRFSGTLQWYEWYGDWLVDDPTRPRALGTWRPVNSHHDISDADQQFSGAKLECLSCHAGHASSGSAMMANPDDHTQPWTGDLNSFCLRCHAGGTPADPGMPAGVVAPTVTVTPDGRHCPPETGCTEVVAALSPLLSCDYEARPWFAVYTWMHDAHGPESKRTWPGYSGAPSYEIDCDVCHDSHGSYSETNPAGNPYNIRDVVDGTPYVDDGNWETGWIGTGAGGGGGAAPTWTTFGTVRDVVIGLEYAGSNLPPAGEDLTLVRLGELCSACHSTWEDMTPPVGGAGGAGGAGGSGGYGGAVPQHWHEFEGCQFCHGHGQNADAHEWYTGDECVGGCHHVFPPAMWDNPWGYLNDTSCYQCGNGFLDRFEECDDGNQVDGDGCSNECFYENGP